jgi:hypothetical protein
VTEYEQRSDGFTAIEDQYACYTVYDPARSKIGKVDDVFLDETDQPEYIGVKNRLPRDELHAHTHGYSDRGPDPEHHDCLSKPKSTVQDGPAFDDREITPEYEREVRSFYGLPATGR